MVKAPWGGWVDDGYRVRVIVDPTLTPPTVSTRDERGYLSLRDDGAIGDGRTVALVAPDGRIDWWPVPDLHCPPAFAAVVDEHNGGRVELAPDEPFTTQRRYRPGTNVLKTVFTTVDGSVQVTDSLNSGVAGRLPWTELARRVDGVSGSVRLRWRSAPGRQLDGCAPWVAQSPSGRSCAAPWPPNC